VLGDSVHHKPQFDAAWTRGIAAISETVWLLQNEGDRQNVESLDKDYLRYAEALSALTRRIENFNATSKLDPRELDDLADTAASSLRSLSLLAPLKTRMVEFLSEAQGFVRVVDAKSLDEIRMYILSCKHLFKGAVGVRHVDFIAHKPH
jgi:hypothetical protein